MTKIFITCVLLTVIACNSPHSASTSGSGTIHFGTFVSGCIGDGICSISQNSTAAHTTTEGIPFTYTLDNGNLSISFNEADSAQGGFHPPKGSNYLVQKGYLLPNFIDKNAHIASDYALYSLNNGTITLKIPVSN